MGGCISASQHPPRHDGNVASVYADDEDDELGHRIETESDGTLAYENPVLNILRVKATNVKSFISHGITSDVNQFASDADEQSHVVTPAQARFIERWIDEGIQAVLKNFLQRASADRREQPASGGGSEDEPRTEAGRLLSDQGDEGLWDPRVNECMLLISQLHTCAIVLAVNDFCKRKGSAAEQHCLHDTTGEPLTIEAPIASFLVTNIPEQAAVREVLCAEYDTFTVPLIAPKPLPCNGKSVSSETDGHALRSATETGSSAAEGSISSAMMLAPYAAHGNPWLERPLTDEAMRVHNKYVAHLERNQLEAEKRSRPCSLNRLIFGLPGTQLSGWM